MVFYWRLNDSKSPQFFRTLFSCLAVLNNAVVWMVFTRPPTSKSSSPFNNPFVTVPKTPITIGKIVTFMSYSFFQFSSKVEVLILLFSFFPFYSVVWRNTKTDNFANSLFFVDYYMVIVIIYSFRVFTSVLADGFSLEFEWQQVSSSLQDSFQDSSRSQLCCRLDSLYSPANFQVFQAF